MKNNTKQIENLIRLNKITESLFTAIQFIYLNDLKVDDVEVARLKNVTNDFFKQKINKLRELLKKNTMKNYKYLKECKMIEKAIIFENKSKNLLNTAVKEVAKHKGFSNYNMFSADFSSGTEIIVNFNDEGEMCDYHFEDFLHNTKKDIINRFLEVQFQLTEETYNLLISEL